MTPTRLTRLLQDEHGTSTTTGMVLCLPVLAVLLFAGLQAAAWAHTRAETRAVARDTAALVARQHAGADAAAESATTTLRTETNLADPTVTITTDADTVTVTITGRAPGIIRGTPSTVTAAVAMPVEQWTPLG